MVARIRAKALLGAFAVSTGALLAPCSQAHQDDDAYSITTPDAAIVGYVTSDSVQIQVDGPAKGIRRAVLTLNGHDVTKDLRPGATGGSLEGSVSGLSVGSNTFRLFESKGSKDPVARLVIERATLN